MITGQRFNWKSTGKLQTTEVELEFWHFWNRSQKDRRFRPVLFDQIDRTYTSFSIVFTLYPRWKSNVTLEGHKRIIDSSPSKTHANRKHRGLRRKNIASITKSKGTIDRTVRSCRALRPKSFHTRRSINGQLRRRSLGKLASTVFWNR